MANVVTALAIGLTLAFLTPLFYYLPTPILAAITLVAVSGLIDVKEAIHLWKVKRDDLMLLAITFGATILLTIELGILIGVGASLLWLVRTTTRPVVAVLGRVEGTNSYRDVKHFPEAETYRRILILRMDAQFFFGNVVYLKDTLFKRLDEMEDPVALVLDASAMTGLDSTAADTYHELISELRRQHVEVFISHVKGAVLKVMEQTEIVELLGKGHLFYEVENAVQAALRHRKADEKGVPPELEDFGDSDPLEDAFGGWFHETCVVRCAWAIPGNAVPCRGEKGEVRPHICENSGHHRVWRHVQHGDQRDFLACHGRRPRREKGFE